MPGERPPVTRDGTAKQMRLRVLDGVNPTWVDKYGLNAYIYDSKSDGKVRYDRVLFSTTKSGNDKVGDLKEGEWADVKVTISSAATDPLNGKTGAMLVKVERLASDLSDYTGELEASGGRDYISFLVDAVPTAANVEYHARIVGHRGPGTHQPWICPWMRVGRRTVASGPSTARITSAGLSGRMLTTILRSRS